MSNLILQGDFDYTDNNSFRETWVSEAQANYTSSYPYINNVFDEDINEYYLTNYPHVISFPITYVNHPTDVLYIVQTGDSYPSSLESISDKYITINNACTLDNTKEYSFSVSIRCRDTVGHLPDTYIRFWFICDADPSRNFYVRFDGLQHDNATRTFQSTVNNSQFNSTQHSGAVADFKVAIETVMTKGFFYYGTPRSSIKIIDNISIQLTSSSFSVSDLEGDVSNIINFGTLRSATDAGEHAYTHVQNLNSSWNLIGLVFDISTITYGHTASGYNANDIVAPDGVYNALDFLHNHFYENQSDNTPLYYKPDGFNLFKEAILIIKNEDGNAALPEYNYDGIGSLGVSTVSKSITLTSGSSQFYVVGVSNQKFIQEGQPIAGNGIPNNTIIASWNQANGYGNLSKNATFTGNSNCTLTLDRQTEGIQIRMTETTNAGCLKYSGKLLTENGFHEAKYYLNGEGWRILAFPSLQAMDALEFIQRLDIEDRLVIMKDNNGDAYLPEFNYNGIGNLYPGQGYQIKITS